VSLSVDKVEFNSRNMTFVVDDARLSVNGKVDDYAAYDFGDGEYDNATIELKGPGAMIVSSAARTRANFGCRHDGFTPKGVCTVRFVVPAAGWESEPRIKAVGVDSKVVFYSNSRLEIDATALGVPEEGETKSVLLASGTGDNGVYVGSMATNIVCAAGAKGAIKVESQMLVLEVVADSTFQPEQPSSDIEAEWGYVKRGLGAFGNEVAVVFTNDTAEAMTWTVPANLTNVQFLVVGGGGGGGGDNCASDGCVGGGGGGGGGVVTGLVYSIAKDAVVTVSVGAGGAGGKAGTKPGTSSYDNYGAGKIGSNSSFAIGGITYVTAKGGGRDLGVSKTISSGTRYQGGQGGSSAGSRAKKTTQGDATQGEIGSGAANLLEAVLFGNKGGAGVSSFDYASAGGGGATEPGHSPESSSQGGKGGEGLLSEMTGTAEVYGSGGGGGTALTAGVGGAGGTNAGDGHRTGKANGENGVANRGGGGGGGGGQANGGAGGSGIVVLRYAIATTTTPVPSIAPKAYTGELLTADVQGTAKFTVTENNGGVDVGNYDVVLTVNTGYTWEDEELPDTITLTFSITQAANVWTVEPAITKSSWTLGVDEPGVLTAGETQFGSVAATIAKNGGAATAFDGMLPTEAGEYVVTYATAATANYTAPDETEKSVSFTIYAADAIPPYTLSTGTLSVNGERTLSVPYLLACDVSTTKTADIYVRYALDGAETTNTVQIATGVALGGGSGTGTVADLKSGATYWVDAYAVVDEEPSDATSLESVSVPGPATGLAATATFTNDPKEFIISGSVTPGLGPTIVTVEWSLNSDALDSRETFTFGYGDDGVFSNIVSYAELSDSLTWRVSVSNAVTTGTWGEQVWGDATETATKTRADKASVTYTWTGAGGDNLWTNVANWTASQVENFGYPNSSYATAHFATPGAVADLDGGTFGVRDGGAGLTFAKNLGEVTLRNGTLNMNSSGSELSFGASGTTVVFDTMQLTRFSKFNFKEGAPVVFAGESTHTWVYRPWNASGTSFGVRNGTLQTAFHDIYMKGTHSVTISNATWTVGATTAANGAFNPGTRIYYYDGDDRQAQIISEGVIRLVNRHTIRIPSIGHADASFIAPTLNSESSSCTFAFDVTEYSIGKKVPVVRFTGADQTSAIESKTLTVVAYVDGVDVTEKRNAQLVWSSEDNTLYYKQDSKNGLVIVVQ
jgi:hypothetical protein